MSELGVPAEEVAAKDFIMVRAKLVQRLGGANEAIVWARVFYRCDEDSRVAYDRDGERWWKAPATVVAAETGLSAKQARAALDRLVDGGYLVAEQHLLGSNYDRSYSYRPVVVPGNMDVPDRGNESAESGESGVPDSGNAPSTETSPYGRKKGAAERGTRIPQPFVVTPEMVAWAREHAPLVNGQRSTQRFENHWLAKTGRDATKLDWTRTWQNWLLKDQEDAEARGGRKATTVENARTAAEILAARDGAPAKALAS